MKKYKGVDSHIALTYDDIQLVPAYSNIPSRTEISLETNVSRRYKMKVPFIASPMDTVCDSEMAIAMAELGGVGCIHRFNSVTEQVVEVLHVVAKLNDLGLHSEWNGTIPVMAAVGANGDYLERAKALVEAGANIILIDVAHGYHENVKIAIAKLKQSLPNHVDIIAGNIATDDAAIALEEWGADGLRVGIGGGSLCTTRVKTGFGVPNITSLIDVTGVAKTPIWACGGIRNSGDIAKALAVGANCVVLGSLLAGTKEAPGAILESHKGLYKRYRGAASLETKIVHGQQARNVEGESTLVPFKGGVKFIVQGLIDGVKSSLSYVGARSLNEFRPDYIRVTNAGIAEARPHLL